MAKRIASAIGTEMQFMPQPEKGYQENVGGVQGVRGTTPASSSASMLASATSDFNNAWLSFLTDREKRMNDAGLTEANRMISSTSAEDRERLSTIDLAMTYGFGSNVDNPYFIAYSDKLRGQALGDATRIAYNEQYGDSPAKTPEEEVARYDNFASSYKQRYLDDGLVSNDVAFNQGFNDKHIENQTQLASNHVERDISDRIAETFNNMKSQIGSLIYDAPSMSFDTIQQKAQEIFNQGKLMALNPEQRQALVDTFTKEMLSTGTIKDFPAFKKMMDNISVETRLDGTSVSMSDLVDPMALDTINLEYRKAHVSNLKMANRKKYGKDNNLDRVMGDVIKGLQSNSRTARDDAEELMGQLPEIHGLQREHKAAMAKAAKAQATKLKGALKTQAGLEAAAENINAYMNGDGGVAFDGYHNKIGEPMVGGKAVDADTKKMAFLKAQQDILSSDDDEDTKGQRLMKLYSYPGVNDIRSQLSNSILMEINSATSQDVESNGAPNSIIYMVRARQSNKGQFAGVFGKKVDTAIGAIQKFADASGEADADNALIRGYSNYCKIKDMDDTTKNAYASQFRGMISKGWSIDDMEDWGDSSAYAPSIQLSDARILDTAQDKFMLYGPAINDTSRAVLETASDIAESYAYFHGAVFPKNCFNSGVASEQTWAKQALETYLYDFADKTNTDVDDVSVNYDDNTGSWSFYSKTTGASQIYSASDMRNEIQWIATKPADTDDGGSGDNTSYSVTPAPTSTQEEIDETTGSSWTDWFQRGLQNLM